MSWSWTFAIVLVVCFTVILVALIQKQPPPDKPN